MRRNRFILILSHLLVLLLSVGAFAGSGEDGLRSTILALDVCAGKVPPVEITADSDIDSDNKIGLAEAIYNMQLAGGIPFFGGGVKNYKEDFLLNALEFEITEGERRELVVLDMPRAGGDDNAFNRQDLIFDVLCGNVAIESENTSDTKKGTLYYIRGLKPGVAEIKVSYPGYQGQETVIAVHVKEADASGPELKTNTGLTKYDIVYFTEETTEYSIGYTVAEGATVSADIRGTTYAPVAGKLKVQLKDGYNTVVIRATDATGTTTKVHNIRAKKLAYAITNLTRVDSNDLYEGDKIAISFAGLVTPIPKVSRIYNPSDVHTTFSCDLPRYSKVTGAATQYGVGTDNRLEIELTADGDFTFSDGHIDENWFGSAMYAETPVGTAPPVTSADQLDHSFSVLPDIRISVLDNPDYNPVLFETTLENTEEIWPGDEVVVTIPHLDIETLRRNHTTTTGWIVDLIDSTTIFASTIPGLDTVKSDHVKTLEELTNLKALTFVVPKDTPPGTYQLRGGYVWVKHGPTWWTRETEYFKARISDVIIEVKEPVPGQVHGAVPVANSALKGKLALAAGKDAGYADALTAKELKAITGSLDLSGTGLTDADMALMKYLKGVTEIDLSNNPGITSATANKESFDWTVEKTLNFSGCTGITELPALAFKDCENLTGITLPEGLTALGASCFESCSNLTAISLPEHVTALGEKCFKGCNKLAGVSLSTALETLGAHCFANCSALTEITIPDGVTALPANTFSSCSTLKTVHLSKALQSIGDSCFAYCNALSDITLPETLTAIGSQAFCFAKELKSIRFPKSLTTLTGYCIFSGTGITVADLRDASFTKEDIKSNNGSWQIPTRAAFLYGDDLGLAPASAAIILGGESQQFTHPPQDGKTITWGSSDETVAVVDGNGVVTGVQGGNALIYAKADDDSASGLAQITVTDDGRAILKALELSGIELKNELTPETYFYSASVDGEVRSTSVTANSKDADDRIAVNGTELVSGVPSEPVALNVGETPIEIAVTSEDGAITKTYVITVNMKAFLKKGDEIVLGNLELKNRLARKAGKPDDFSGNLTVADLAGITGELDLSNAGITTDGMKVMKYLTGVSAFDLSGNAKITRISPDDFDWETPKSLNLRDCSGIHYFPDFDRIDGLTGIVLPNSIKQLFGTFWVCTHLTYAILPEGIEKLARDTFSCTDSLEAIHLPESLTTLGDSCFACSGIKSINIPSQITALPSRLFIDCKHLTFLSLPAAVTEIGANCFKGCRNLAVLDLRQTAFTEADPAWRVPESTIILFKGSQSAGFDSTEAAINLGEETLTLSSTIGEGQPLIWGSSDPETATVTKDGVVTGVKPGTAYIYVTTPDGTVSSVCKVTCTPTASAGLASLSLSAASLNEAFDPNRFSYTAELGCYVEAIGVTAGLDQEKASLTVNGQATAPGTPSAPVALSMGDNTITVQVTSGEKVKTYRVKINKKGVYEEEDAISLNNRPLTQKLGRAAGKGEAYVGPLTFQELAAIEGPLSLSNLGVTDGEMAVMKYLKNVTAIDLSNNPAITGATVVKETFDWTKAKSLDFEGCAGITAIADEAFYKGSAKEKITLTGIVLPETVATFGYRSFYECESLTSLNLSEGIKEIGGSCFGKTAIPSVTLPGSVEKLGSYLFTGCKSLTQADLSGVSLEVLAQAKGCFQSCTAITDTKCVKFPEGITSLPANFFAQCKGITQIELPETIKELGDSAFSVCSGLTAVDLSSYTTLGEGLLSNCSNLKRVTFPDGITTLPSNFFNGCTWLTEIHLPSTITEIGYGAFKECANLTEMTLADTITTLGSSVFEKCIKLRKITLPAGMTALPNSFFQHCHELSGFAIADTIKSIGSQCFAESGLRYLAIPGSVTEISWSCFSGDKYLAILDLRESSFAAVDSRWRVPSTTEVLLKGSDAGLSFDTKTITTGESFPLTHDIDPEKSVRWISSNSAVAEVTETGEVTGVSKGSVVIAVKTEDGTSCGTCRVTVQ